MQEKTSNGEHVLVHRMLWNCQKSWEQQRPRGASPKEEGATDPPRWPPASEHAAKRLYSGLVTDH